ncbi:MAG: DUF1848 family protein [Candidatus Delongbacteria bacterium]|nr:DUF1848 family protein [Candidatus Delongbacteria bacterium]MBN2834614.1 DUF1848 family protein [Candidatus Delongbacteria bacterium]
MVLSISRRTDIPAFFYEWLYKRLDEHKIGIYNPYNRKSRIVEIDEELDFLYFWSKEPSSLLKMKDVLKNYKFRLHYTLNNYGFEIESTLPSLETRIMVFKKLVDLYGNKLIWRYDPIFYNKKYSFNHHINSFMYISQKLKGYTDLCYFSFIDTYKKNEQDLSRLGLVHPDEENKLMKSLFEIGKTYGIKLYSCCETIDPKTGIESGSCIDPELMIENGISGCNILSGQGTRKLCRCAKSYDVGLYNTCITGCKYCYASNQCSPDLNLLKKHNPKTPLIFS